MTKRIGEYFLSQQKIIRLCAVFWCVASSVSHTLAQHESRQTLSKALAPSGVEVGGALHSYPRYMPPDRLLNLADAEFSAVTASVYMPYGVWEDPSRNPDTSGWEELVDWADRRGLRVHGHALLYPTANRSLAWWNELPLDAVEDSLSSFITRLATVRAGKVWVWDVVNEVIADDGVPMDQFGLRTDVKEYAAMGADYVEKAFRWARAADPKAALIINDYGAEPENNKSDRLFAFAKRLRDRGVPIDGVGFQMHYFEPDTEPDYDSVRRNLKRFADAGFRLFITEMDVVAKRGDSDNNLPSTAQLERQRRIYQTLTRIAIEEPAVESLLFWDFVDQESWLHPAIGDNGVVREGEYTFPAVFRYDGNEIVKKPAYFGVQSALERIGK